MKRTVTMLCPVCQCTGSVVLESTDSDMELWLTPSAKCKMCGTKMYAADAELVPTLQALNSRGIITLYHCSNAHEGADAFRKDLEDETRMYDGAYIIIQDAGDILYGILENRISEYNVAKRDERFKMSITVETTSIRGTFEQPEAHTRATVKIYTRDNFMSTMRTAVTEFNAVILAALAEYEEKHGEYRGISKERMAHLSNRTRINMFSEDESEDLGIPYMRHVVVHTDI